MRYIALFLSLLIGPACFAAKPAKVAGAAEFGRKIAAANNWDSLFKSVDGSLNPLVMKELRALTADLPYPQTRVKNDRLMISNENGEHLTMVLFEKDGDVSFNGKRWTLQPLATTGAEVERIAGMLGAGHASLWDYVVPPARAGGLGMTRGVAAAAYTSAAAWKAEACAKPNPSDELVKQCSLMAVSMEGNVTPQQATTFKAIRLNCPTSSNNALTLISKNRLGSSNRSVVVFNGNKPISATYYISSDGVNFIKIYTYEFSNPTNPKFKPAAEKLAIQSMEINSAVCSAEKPVRNAYLAKLDANAKSLQVSSAEGTQEDEKSARTGL